MENIISCEFVLIKILTVGWLKGPTESQRSTIVCVCVIEREREREHNHILVM